MERLRGHKRGVYGPMSNLIWDKQHSIGHDELDNQHRELIRIYNEFSSAVKRGENRAMLDNLLNQLIDNIDIHFTSEENHMVENDYPDLMIHKKEHDRFLIEFNKLRAKFSHCESDSCEALPDFLKNWFATHFVENDRKFAEYINGAKIKANPFD